MNRIEEKYTIYVCFDKYCTKVIHFDCLLVSLRPSSYRMIIFNNQSLYNHKSWIIIYEKRQEMDVV